MRNLLSSFALALAAVAAAGSMALAHPPGHHTHKAPPKAAPPAQAETPGPAGRNLKVLPARIPQERLIGVMREWSGALGVQCSYCHVAGNFASDANPHKNLARGMVTMTKRINDELLPPVVGKSDQARVTCYSCHGGSPIPKTEAPEPPTVQKPAKPGEPLPAHIAPDTPARPH
jgi:hypothetical protein